MTRFYQFGRRQAETFVARKGPMVPAAGVHPVATFLGMEGSGRLTLVPGCGGGQLAGDLVEAGFTALLEIWDSAIEELVGEMPPDELRALLIVGRAGSVSLERLAGALGASTPATSSMCDGMEAAGLLRRGRGAGTGVIMIVPTARGRRVVARIREQRRAVLDYVLESLTPDGRESLARALSEFAASRA